MRFEERDEREAYRRGVRDCFETMTATLTAKEARQIEAWLQALDDWDHGEPPLAPPK
jgi:hypothetical protein